DYVFDRQIYSLGCDTLPQVKFWQKIMKLSKDSCLVNIAYNRTIVATMSNADWNSQSDSAKTAFRSNVRKQYGLADSVRILVTEGKSFFYDFDRAYGNLHQGIQGFIANGVDPWYAQAILLIESPNKLQKSNVGAYGSFQLMKPVARMFGLKVNKKIDERADFDRSAYAASSLIKRVCIPKTKEMLDSLHIKYDEQDVWFRLLVMHSYHAGSGNVKAALTVINPTEGGIELIKKLWGTSAAGFRTASQNYSQLALAAMIEMNRKVGINGQPVSN
ncbi:MAG TPA: transglycosylase SLT domain-containing protein, partial [Bacteroidia bacterium]